MIFNISIVKKIKDVFTIRPAIYKKDRKNIIRKFIICYYFFYLLWIKPSKFVFLKIYNCWFMLIPILLAYYLIGPGFRKYRNLYPHFRKGEYVRRIGRWIAREGKERGKKRGKKKGKDYILTDIYVQQIVNSCLYLYHEDKSYYRPSMYIWSMSDGYLWMTIFDKIHISHLSQLYKSWR